MNRTRIYTFLSLALILVFVFGSMAGMKLILNIKEKQLLTEKGKAIIESPVQAWQYVEGTEQEDNKEKFNGDKHSLTLRQAEEAIISWNERIGETMHNPVEGQISMEEAIKSGEEWLTHMEVKEEAQENGTAFKFVNASLGVGEQREAFRELLEPYYSFWTVQFSDQGMDAVLYINAVTGKVWSARLTLYENMPKDMPYEKLVLFVELAGLRIPDKHMAEINSERTEAVLMLDDSQMYARLEYRNVIIGEDTVVEHMSKEMTGDKYVVINYELMAD